MHSLDPSSLRKLAEAQRMTCRILCKYVPLSSWSQAQHEIDELCILNREVATQEARRVR